MIHYEISGESGPWLVFVHGMTCAGSDWHHQVDALADRHRCLCVDLRGHGRSADLDGPYDIDTMAGDVAGLMHGLAIGDAVLIGHSLGTRVITALTMQVPERVAGLVFVDGSMQGRGDPLLAREQALAVLGEPDQQARYCRTMFEDMFTAASDAAEKRAIVERAAQMPSERFREIFCNMATWDAGRLESALMQIRQPVCVLQSTRVSPERKRFSLQADERTPYLDMLARRLADVQIRAIADTGHFTQLDAPRLVSEAIAAVAAGTRPG
ncbi:MAG: alpha/beta hydrolase [Burkholderiaceae bacterium]